MPTEEDIIRATLKDLTEDLESIANAAYAEAVRVRKAYKSDTKDDIVSKTAQDVIVLYETLAHNARNELEASAHWSEEDISRLVAMKNHCAISMREVANLAGAAMTARSWQAPGTGVDMAMKARILTFFDENPNNYKRGGFSESTDYERRFAKEYIDGSMIPPQVHLTSSGMSACLTALVHLKSKKRPRNKPHHVLVGASTYFENLWLLQQLFQGEITSVDEADEERILSLVKEMQPSILLFDTVTYSSSLIVPNWGTLVKKLSHALTGPSTLILDNSYMGAGYQPLADMPWSVTGMDLIVVESLNKFYEFGTDRVSGGVIWTTRNIDGSIQVARNHCGTMLAEASVAALPLPSRARFGSRDIGSRGRRTRS